MNTFTIAGHTNTGTSEQPIVQRFKDTARYQDRSTEQVLAAECRLWQLQEAICKFFISASSLPQEAVRFCWQNWNTFSKKQSVRSLFFLCAVYHKRLSGLLGKPANEKLFWTYLQFESHYVATSCAALISWETVSRGSGNAYLSLRCTIDLSSLMVTNQQDGPDIYQLSAQKFSSTLRIRWQSFNHASLFSWHYSGALRGHENVDLRSRWVL